MKEGTEMRIDRRRNAVTRRELLRGSAAFAGGALLTHLFPGSLSPAGALAYAQQPKAVSAGDAATAAGRAMFGAAPIQSAKLAANMTLLSGPGGNVVVLTGSDGILMVDTFVRPAWPRLQMTLASMSAAPVKTVIDSHWHFDHSDNNESLHAAGATIMGHANTKKRMSEDHTLAVLGMHFPPSPAAARPSQVFEQTRNLSANGQNLTLTHLPPAHTDTDIATHFQEANVLHCGDVFFNGMFPYIDQGTGGSLAGMIAGSAKLLTMVDDKTKVIPGHGALGTKADLAKFHEMLLTARERLQKLRASGKTLEEAVAAKPFADLDPVWGKGNFNGDAFVHIAYPTI